MHEHLQTYTFHRKERYVPDRQYAVSLINIRTDSTAQPVPFRLTRNPDFHSVARFKKQFCRFFFFVLGATGTVKFSFQIAASASLHSFTRRPTVFPSGLSFVEKTVVKCDRRLYVFSEGAPDGCTRVVSGHCRFHQQLTRRDSDT